MQGLLWFSLLYGFVWAIRTNSDKTGKQCYKWDLYPTQYGGFLKCGIPKSPWVSTVKWSNFGWFGIPSMWLWLKVVVMICFLVGGLNSSEKYESQLGSLFPIYGKIKAMFQTTNQFLTLPILDTLQKKSLLVNVDIPINTKRLKVYLVSM